MSSDCSKLWAVAWMLLVVSCSYSWASIQCLGRDGKPVDWFIGYKLPKNSDPRTSGADFLYMDTKTPSWQRSQIAADKPNQPLGYTLQQIYTNVRGNRTNQDIGYGIYNDQPPSGSASSKFGHTKGVFALDSATGFWLVHSIPKFADPLKYKWPSNGDTYGQTFICISLAYQQFEEIGKQLMRNCPNIYKKQMPAFTQKLSSLYEAVASGSCNAPSSSNTAKLQTLGQQEIISFAKSTSFNNDLYSALVAPYLKSSLYAETWRSSLPSSCNTQYKVFNVNKVSLQAGSTKYSLTSGQDHSKWAVAENIPWVCIGDINRDETQFKRGGGTVCIKHSNVHTAFKSAVTDWERCSKPRRWNKM